MSSASYRPLISEPELLARLEGHRYVVLRPDEAVRGACASVQAVLRTLSMPISYPAEAHVTMAGFPRGVACRNVHRVLLTARWRGLAARDAGNR